MGEKFLFPPQGEKHPMLVTDQDKMRAHTEVQSKGLGQPSVAASLLNMQRDPGLQLQYCREEKAQDADPATQPVSSLLFAGIECLTESRRSLRVSASEGSVHYDRKVTAVAWLTL